MNQSSKPFFYSKTFWVQILACVAIAVPVSRDFIANNLGETGAAWAVINIILRAISKDGLSIT